MCWCVCVCEPRVCPSAVEKKYGAMPWYTLRKAIASVNCGTETATHSDVDDEEQEEDKRWRRRDREAEEKKKLTSERKASAFCV